MVNPVNSETVVLTDLQIIKFLLVERETHTQWSDGRRASGEWPVPTPVGKVHQCPHCAYSTTDSFKLRRHTLKHTGERPFSCPYCSYGTTRKELLKEHINLHTGEKPYNCSFCPYSASQRSSLNVHLRRHTGERPYTCTHCPYQSAHKVSLKNHMLDLCCPLSIHVGDIGEEYYLRSLVPPSSLAD
ncbi:zinc finger protein 771-like [Scylla paramamosain]|uniref:zinc finger protein 771-like n=1 Tax=Scylla paramamosain TaxID=85552 RepID=UPI0030834E7E